MARVFGLRMALVSAEGLGFDFVGKNVFTSLIKIAFLNCLWRIFKILSPRKKKSSTTCHHYNSEKTLLLELGCTGCLAPHHVLWAFLASFKPWCFCLREHNEVLQGGSPGESKEALSSHTPTSGLCSMESLHLPILWVESFVLAVSFFCSCCCCW